jgi:hypothetical protein
VLLGVDRLLLLGLVLSLCGVNGFLLGVRLGLRLIRQRNLHSLRMRDVRQRILNGVNLVVLKERLTLVRISILNVPGKRAMKNPKSDNRKTHLNI